MYLKIMDSHNKIYVFNDVSRHFLHILWSLPLVKDASLSSLQARWVYITHVQVTQFPVQTMV